MALIDPNNRDINNRFPRTLRILNNLRPWAKKSHVAPTKIQPNPPGEGIEVGEWVQHALNQGWITVSGTSQIVDNAGPLSGAAPTGAVFGIDNVNGNLYYVTGGNWAIVNTGGNTVTFQTVTNTTDIVTTANYILLEASSALTTIEFPASPTAGDQITVKVLDITNGCEVDGNGNNIDGSASNFIFSSPNAATTFTYNATSDWLTS